MAPPGVCMNIVNARHQKDGSGTYENPEKFLKQDYQQMKRYLLQRRVTFIDEMFPPDRRSIGREVLSPADTNAIVWRRPHELASNPCFVVDGVSRFDFGQGVVGDCWFLASIGALTFQDFIFERVVPQDQNFDNEYCGMFHFRFWRFGRWVDVIIDDKLPTINGRLIFVHSNDPNEFWPALLEKAYAKVCGSYADMNAGTPSEALVDFTGGVHMSIKLADPYPQLWELLCRAGQSRSLMGCGTYPGATSENTVLPNGIVQGHAYAVTGVRQMMSRGQPVRLVRLWNPWGQREWTGDWSDRSPLWQTVSPEERKLCLEVGDNGEFWMTLQDFCKYYSDLDICALCPDFLDGSSSCHWKTSYYEGRWVAGITAGGCMNNRGTFWTNPQYRVTVEALLSECSQTQGGDNMLVSLMQKPDKRNRRLVQNLHIGFSIFEVSDQYKGEKGKLSEDFFARNQPVAQTQSYVNAREVMLLLMLKPGEYLIVPSTFKPNETASFILTILSKAETHVHENSGDHHHEHGGDHHHEEQPLSPAPVREDDEKTLELFRQNSDKYEEVDAEQLQKILNDVILKGELKSGGFSIDACRSMIALMDTSVTGKLNADEFLRMWRKVCSYMNIFYRTDVSKTGTLSLNELRNAIMTRGKPISDDMLNLMALRYGGSSGNITLESFISLVLRFDCMIQIFGQLSDGLSMTLREKEWLYLSMYT